MRPVLMPVTLMLSVVGAAALAADPPATGAQAPVVVHMVRHQSDSAEDRTVETVCPTGATRVESERTEAGADGQQHRTRIILCERTAEPGGAGDKLTRLRAARTRLAEDPELSPEIRSSIIEALDAEIARARAGQPSPP